MSSKIYTTLEATLHMIDLTLLSDSTIYWLGMPSILMTFAALKQVALHNGHLNRELLHTINTSHSHLLFTGIITTS